MIGAYSKMQRVSLDQEVELWSGIPYNINFYQDFSTQYLDGWRIVETPVSEIIQAIVISPDEIPEHSDVGYPSRGDYLKSQELWDYLEKQEKKNRKREKKYRKKHPKPKNIREAEQNFEHIVDDIMRGI